MPNDALNGLCHFKPYKRDLVTESPVKSEYCTLAIINAWEI